nr:DUF427 domain-containing protein [Cytophagales bacterium]
MKAIWKNTIIAESQKTIKLEGNHYFPPDTIKDGYLKPSSSKSICPWKGEASYYTIEVNGELNKDAAWVYRNPKTEASEIKEHIAFWKGVKIEE